MFNQQFNIPKQHYRVDKYPEFDELKKYIEQASKIKGVKHCYYWTDNKTKKQFTLTIHIKASNTPTEPEFWMHESSDLGPKMLWFYRTGDYSVIYPQILQAVGAPDITKGEKEVDRGSLTDRLGGMAQVGQTPYVTPGGGAATQQQASNRAPSAKLISGNLDTLPMSTILQTAQKEDSTGRLLIESPDMGNAIVHFLHGRPVHAQTPSQAGLEALLELFVWVRGKVTFTHGTKADTTSIQPTTDQILYQGAQMLENIGFLQENNIDEHSVIRKASMAISEQEFEKRILEGPPLGLDLQKRFYQSLDGGRDLRSLANLLGLTASQWIGIVSNLLRLGLVLTPDGRNLHFSSQQEIGSYQRVTNSFGQPNPPGHPPPVQQPPPPQPAGTNKPPSGPQGGAFGRNQEFQSTSGGWNEQQQIQSTSGNFTTQSTSGSWNPQATSGSFNYQATSGSWNPQATSGGWASPPPGSGKAPVPPLSVFGGMGQGSGDMPPPSPAVEAFITASSTVQEIDTVHVGIQTTEVTFNRNVPKNIIASLNNRETGILSFEAIQFFLEREFARSFRYSHSFSLVVFCMKLRSSGGRPTMLASKVVSLTCNAINTIKHDVDIFGHFGEKSYALILPNTNSSQAAALVDKITTNLVKIAPELTACRPAFYIGIASVPQDAKDVESLVAAAQKAMMEAVKRNVTRLLYSDL